MKINLTEKETEYLSNKIFWDLQRAEVDVDFPHMAGKTIEQAEKDLRFYRRLDKKLTPKESHEELKLLGKEVLNVLLTFMVGLIIATAYHMFITNKMVRSTAERVCETYGRDEQECKDGIDDLLDMSDNIVDNNINVEGE